MTELVREHHFSEGDPAAPVLLLLHGTGGGTTDLLDLGRELSPSSALLAPAGSVLENGARRWFRRFAEGVFDYEDVIIQAGELAEFVRAASDHYGLVGRRIVAVGFSNGANIGAALTLLHPEVVTAAVLFAAMLPVLDPPEYDLSATQVFLSNGERDPMAPKASVEKLAMALSARAADVMLRWHSGGHQITESALWEARVWLAQGL